MLLVTTALSFSGMRSVRADDHVSSEGPRILVLRGLFEVFSLGMNDLAAKLRERGYDAEVTSWTLALNKVDYSDPRPIVVVGHSLGGRMCGAVARKYQEQGRRVPLIIIVDANLLQKIPPNVDKCVNLFVTNELGVFHGSPVSPETGGTPIVNWDISKGQTPWYQGGVNHFDIDATDWVHQIIIRNIDDAFRPVGKKESQAKAVVDQSFPAMQVKTTSDSFRLPKHQINSNNTDTVSTKIEKASAGSADYPQAQTNSKTDSVRLRWRTPNIPVVGSQPNSAGNACGSTMGCQERLPSNYQWPTR